MKTIRWLMSSLGAALLLSACAGPPPTGQDGAGAPAEHPAETTSDTTSSQSQNWELAFGDNFAGGQPQLEWVPYPFFNQDNLRGSIDPTAPETEKGVGVLSNENVGGFAALSYVEGEPLGDFRLETWIYATVTKEERGPLNGIAFRIDPTANRYYRFASHFVAEPSLTLAYVGQDVRNFPISLGTWKGSEIPGGSPTESGWHKLAIEVIGDKAEVYWDSQKLSGGPYAIDRIPSGYVGVYATMAGGLGLAQTSVSGFKVFRPAG